MDGTALCFLGLHPALKERARVQGAGVSGVLAAQLHPMPKPADRRAPGLSLPQQSAFSSSSFQSSAAPRFSVFELNVT